MIRYESFDACAVTIGTAPHRTRIGNAFCGGCREHYLVIYNETSGQRVFVQSAYLGMVVSQGIDGQRFDWASDNNRKWLTEEGDCVHIWCNTAEGKAVPA